MSLWLAWNREICLPLLPLHQLPIQLSVEMSRRGIDPFTDCRFIHCRINFCSAIVSICLKQFVEKHFKTCKDLESHKIFLCILHTPMILRFYYTCLFYVYAWLCEAYAVGYRVCVFLLPCGPRDWTKFVRHGASPFPHGATSPACTDDSYVILTVVVTKWYLYSSTHCLFSYH